jgi:hypothetical protein
MQAHGDVDEAKADRAVPEATRSALWFLDVAVTISIAVAAFS